MRCVHCFRLNSAVMCVRCGQLSSLPKAEAAMPDHDVALLESLAAGVETQEVFDLLCLCLQQGPEPQAGAVLRDADIAMAPLNGELQALYGLYVGLRLEDEALAAAQFCSAKEQADRIDLGEAWVEFVPAGDDARFSIRLHAAESVLDLGVLDCESIAWVDCSLRAAREGLIPRGWSDWHRRLVDQQATLQGLSASLTGTSRASGSGFRERWKRFQAQLGEARDTLGPSQQETALVGMLTQRDRASLRGLDVDVTVAALVESARSALRDSLAQHGQASADAEMRQLFEAVFVECGLDALLAVREDVRRESVTAHAEMRKSLDYQTRLLRTTREALIASLAALKKKASGFMWNFVPRTLFEEAIDQAGLFLERAREVAMIEQGDLWLKGLSQRTDESLTEVINELTQRRTQLESVRTGFDQLLRRLDVDSPVTDVTPAEVHAHRVWFYQTPCNWQTLHNLLETSTRDVREVALV